MVKGFVFLLSGTILAQLIALAATPFLTRVYTPEQFGDLAIIISLVTIASSVGNFKIDLAIQNLTDTLLVKGAVAASLYINLFLIIVVSFFLYVIGQFESSISEVVNLNFWLILIGIILICNNNLLIALALRDHLFKDIALAKTLNIFAMTIIQCSLFLYSDFGLLYGYCLSFIFSIAYYISCRCIRSIVSFKTIDIKTPLRLAKPFVFYTMPASLLNSLGNQSPILLFSFFFGVKIAGFLLVSQKIISTPVKMIADAISKVVYARGNKLKQGDEYIFLKILKGILVSVLPIFVFTFFYIIEIFEIVLGPDWLKAGIYSQYALLLGLVTLIGMPLYNLSLKFEFNKSGMVFEILMALFRVSSIVLTFYIGLNDTNSVAIYYIACSICWLAYILYIIRRMGYGTRRLAIEACRLILLFSISTIPLFINLFIFSNSLSGSILCLLVYVCFFIVRILKVRRDVKETAI